MKDSTYNLNRNNNKTTHIRYYSMNRLFTIGILTSVSIFSSYASESDSLKVVDIETITVFAHPKTHIPLRQQPISTTLVEEVFLQEHNIQSIKELSGLTPNLFIPNYGSSLTSAIYIRGIGSRINSPAVGLYVDNIPYTDKSAFDFQFVGVDRVDVLRGPQGSLYGRNTMGGLVMIHTKDPLHSQGIDYELGGATANMSYYETGHLRMKLSEQTGISLGFTAHEARGIHRNRTLNKWAEYGEGLGVNMRLIHLMNEKMKMNFTLGYEQTNEREYPYQYNGSLEEDGGRYDHLIGTISNNRPHGYNRNMWNVGTHLQWTMPQFTFSSTTGYQWIKDDMRIDQDFLPDDIFTLRQQQNIHTLNQEFILKSSSLRQWKWVTGISGTLQWTKTNAPVDFYGEGIKMIQNAIDEGMKDTGMKVELTNNHLHIPGHFSTPIKGVALFHQSDIELSSMWTLTAGLRLDYERQTIDYNSHTTIHTLFTGMGLTNQTGEKKVHHIGNFHKRQTHLLPRLALTKKTTQGNMYVSFSKGLRSGGYNNQMFSEIIQQSFRSSEFSSEEVRQQINYDPEWSLNYEVGTHLNLFRGTLRADASLFLINTRDQQVSRFTKNGLGRILVNAGRACSWGGELSLLAQATENLCFNLGYGYTHASFTRYDSGISDTGERIDYTGNHVPFAPEHTVSTGVRYDFSLATHPLGINHITFRTDYQGAGRIWWTEANDISQPYYSQLHIGMTLHFKHLELDFYGRNLTDSKFDTFRFHSMGRDFSQVGRPRDFQAKLTWRL